MTSTYHVRQPAQEGHATGGHGGHGWMMIACCIPVLVIAVVLVAAGAASVGFPARGAHVHGHDGDDDARH